MITNILKFSIVKRGIAFYIDFLFVSIIVFIYLYIFDRNLIFETNKGFVWNIDFIWIYQILLFVIYSFIVEYLFGNTIGKSILKFNVIDRGSNNYLFRLFLRTIIKLIPLNVISIFFSNSGLFWHEEWTDVHTVGNGSE